MSTRCDCTELRVSGELIRYRFRKSGSQRDVCCLLLLTEAQPERVSRRTETLIGLQRAKSQPVNRLMIARVLS